MPATQHLLPDPELEPTITVERAARILNIGRSTAYDAVTSKEIPTVRVRSVVRVPTRAFLIQFGLLPDTTTSI